MTDDTQRHPDPDGDGAIADAAGDVTYRYPSDDPDAGDVAAASADGDEAGREVEVPMRLYKTVTVFSTLIAVVTVVVGFVLLDAATLRVSVLRRLVATLLAVVGVDVTEGTLTTLFGLAGLLSIAGGAGVYVLGTRFRAPGMGNAQDERDES